MAEFFSDKPKADKPEFEERVVSVDRVAYTVAGGRRLRFRALVVVGDREGRVGMGVAKAGEVASAIQKAVAAAKKRLVRVQTVHDTIPHAIQVTYGSAVVLLKPAPAGTSVIAGGSVRAVIELAGIKNIRSKVLGSNNKINNVAATIEALQRVRIGQLPFNVKLNNPPVLPEKEEDMVAADEQQPAQPKRSSTATRKISPVRSPGKIKKATNQKQK